MVLTKSQDDKYKQIIVALFRDVFETHGAVFNHASQKLTLQKLQRRLDSEGISFLTKTLPALGKGLDSALMLVQPLNAAKLGFKTKPNSNLPIFLGELFETVLTPEGFPLQDASTLSIASLRQLCFGFYKLKLPYTSDQEQAVIAKFKETEHDLINKAEYLLNMKVSAGLTLDCLTLEQRNDKNLRTIHRARELLYELFRNFDPTDITPRHGPGAVATKQKLWEKFTWKNVSIRIAEKYPVDEYFFVSPGHLCDGLVDCEIVHIDNKDLPARVILVPKDSRGPRLISCEPVDFQWVQQGLGKAIVNLVERHHLTRGVVNFTDQQPNRLAALLGSLPSAHDNFVCDTEWDEPIGRYATLDLEEASDRVSVGLVRLLFPSRLVEYLEACRTVATELPNGEILPLQKFAPMGSSLCFPILALTIWAILAAGLTIDEEYSPSTDELLLVYGDDVIVPAGRAEDAIELLEVFGLKVSRTKSCIKGFFRESCGVDAYKGIDVTPVRFRTLWSSAHSPNSYASYVAYANALLAKKYYITYNVIVEALHDIYGAIPSSDMRLACPSLDGVPLRNFHIPSRWNARLQKTQFKVWDITVPTTDHEMDAWSMLLRYLTESGNPPMPSFSRTDRSNPLPSGRPFSVRTYTQRRASKLVRRWR